MPWHKIRYSLSDKLNNVTIGSDYKVLAYIDIDDSYIVTVSL